MTKDFEGFSDDEIHDVLMDRQEIFAINVSDIISKYHNNEITAAGVVSEVSAEFAKALIPAESK